MDLSNDVHTLVTTLVAYLFSYLVARFYKRLAYSSFNTSRETYRRARTVLLILFFGPLLYLMWTGGAGFYDFAIHDIGKTFTGTPVFVVASVLYVSVILMLDVNYRNSRDRRYESNFFRHVGLGWCFIIPFCACAMICTIPVGMVVLGAMFGKRPIVAKQNPKYVPSDPS